MMNNFLNKYVNEFGKDALWETEKLYDYLSQNSVSHKYIYHLVLVLNFGDLEDIINRSEQRIPSVMLNTAIINTVNNTGLKQKIVQDVFSDVFVALHIGYEGETLFGFNTEKGAVYPIEGNLSPSETERKLESAKKKIKENNEASISEAVQIYNDLSKSGDAEAMYMLAVIKRKELDSELNRLYNRILTAEERKNEQDMIKRLFECAAANGNAKAKAELGDICYENENYDKAYEYYSAPGVVTVKPNTKERIVSILNQRINNGWLIIIGGIFLLGIWVFLFLNSKSVHNSITMFGWGIPINILVSLVYGYMCFSIQRVRYHSHKLFVFIMMILWSIYPLILAIN